jgi:uncharacterized protein (TIGR03435 family)
MRNRIVQGLNLPKKCAIAAAGIAAVATPVVVGVMNLPPMRAQSAPVTTVAQVDPPAIQNVAKPAAARLVARQSASPAAPAPRPQPVPTPAFEVASIKPCAGGEGGGARGGRVGAGEGQGPSPDRLSLSCRPVRTMIRLAYVDFENARRSFPLPNIPIEGGPAWLDSERYEVIAKAEGTPGQDMMRGPMLRVLLEDRLKLKVHRESREVPAYLLVAGKSGPKLRPSEEGSCVAFEAFDPSKAAPPGAEKFIPICSSRMIRRTPLMVTWEVRGGTLDDVAHALGIDLDRIVINKTGIAGKFDFRMEFAPDEGTAGLNRLRTADGPLVTPATASDPLGGPSVFTAIQEQMGLKLEPAKGPREFLVVDRAESLRRIEKASALTAPCGRGSELIFHTATPKLTLGADLIHLSRYRDMAATKRIERNRSGARRINRRLRLPWSGISGMGGRCGRRPTDIFRKEARARTRRAPGIAA